MKKTVMKVILLTTLSVGIAFGDNVRFMNWMSGEESNREVLENLIANSETNVELVQANWGQLLNELNRHVAEDIPLDVVQVQARWLPLIAKIPGVVDFKTVYSTKTLQSIPPLVLNSGLYGDKLLGIPWNTGSISLVTNQKVLHKSGLSEDPMTIKEFISVLRQLKASQPDIIPYAMMTADNGSLSSDFQLWLWAHGGEIFNSKGEAKLNSKAMIKTLEFMKLLIDEELVQFNIDRGVARNLFGNEQTAFYFDAPVARSFARDISGKGALYDTNIKAIQTPVHRISMTAKSMQWGHLLVALNRRELGISDNLSDQSNSATFIKHLTMNDNVQLNYFQSMGAIPITKSARRNIAVRTDRYVADWNNSIGFPKRNELSGLTHANELVEIIESEILQVLRDKKEAGQAANDMQHRLQTVLKH